MTKKQIGWLALVIFVLGAVTFASIHAYRERMAEKKIEENTALDQAVKSVYSDEENGYFKADLSDADFDTLATELTNQKNEGQKALDELNKIKADFSLQQSVNQLFEANVLNGMDLISHPVLANPDPKAKILRLERELERSGAKQKKWGQDIKMLLSLAQKQAEDYDKASETVEKLASKHSSISLSEYLDGVRAVAVLPDSTYKEKLLSKLDPVKRRLANENKQFANEIEQQETSIKADADTYRQKQEKELQEKNKELSNLKKELAEKKATYDSYVSVSRSLETSKSKNSSTSSSTTSTSRSGNRN